jgi:hypothetical protein
MRAHRCAREVRFEEGISYALQRRDEEVPRAYFSRAKVEELMREREELRTELEEREKEKEELLKGQVDLTSNIEGQKTEKRNLATGAEQIGNYPCPQRPVMTRLVLSSIWVFVEPDLGFSERHSCACWLPECSYCE